MRITAAERDALYEQIEARLSGIDAVWIAVEAGDFPQAGEVAREFGDYLILILEDLGWGKGSGEPLELTSPPEVLRRVLNRMRSTAEAEQEHEEGERAESLEREERTRQVLSTCRRVLDALG